MLNWLRVPLAAITLFAGIAAYGIVVGLTPALIILILVTAIFLALAPPLPQDRYLLLSLASLAIARSVAGSLKWVGGELGISATLPWVVPQRPDSAILYAIFLFLAALFLLLLLQRTETGLAVDVTRTAATYALARSMAPAGALTGLLLVSAVTLAALTGAVQSGYAGWIDPSLFRIDHAITLLVATLTIGRAPVLGTLLAISFFLLPELFSMWFGYDHASAAHVREILWGSAILFIAGRSTSPPARSGA